MRGIESSRDINARTEIEKIERIKRAKRVNKLEKKEKTTPAGHYEERGMTKEDKERETSMTPQEIFRMQQRQYSKINIELQKQNNNRKEQKEIEEEQQEK